MAKKINIKNTLIKFLPLVILLAGLIIMTVCFFVNGGKLQDANACNAELTAKVDALTADVAAKQAEIDELTAQLADGSELDALKADLDAKQAELDAANAEIESLESAIEEANATLDAVMAALGLDLSVEETAEEAPAAE